MLANLIMKIVFWRTFSMEIQCLNQNFAVKNSNFIGVILISSFIRANFVGFKNELKRLKRSPSL